MFSCQRMSDTILYKDFSSTRNTAKPGSNSRRIYLANLAAHKKGARRKEGQLRTRVRQPAVPPPPTLEFSSHLILQSISISKSGLCRPEHPVRSLNPPSPILLLSSPTVSRFNSANKVRVTISS